LRDAIEAPGGFDEFLGELGFGSGCRLVFIEELAAVALVSGGIFGSEDRGVAGKAVGEGILRRTLFTGGGGGRLRAGRLPDLQRRGSRSRGD
jgi:hypothetical protein